MIGNTASGRSPHSRWVALIGLLVLAAVAGASLWGWQTGSRPFVVVSGSMAPAIDTGDAVIVRPDRDLTAGDIATYTIQGQTVTHRIIEVVAHGFRTQGDANAAADPTPISAEQIIGQASLRVPFGGYILVYLQQWSGLATILLLPFTLNSGWRLAGSLSGSKDPFRAERGQAISAEHHEPYFRPWSRIGWPFLRTEISALRLHVEASPYAVETAARRTGSVWS